MLRSKTNAFASVLSRDIVAIQERGNLVLTVFVRHFEKTRFLRKYQKKRLKLVAQASVPVGRNIPSNQRIFILGGVNCKLKCPIPTKMQYVNRKGDRKGRPGRRKVLRTQARRACPYGTHFHSRWRQLQIEMTNSYENTRKSNFNR